MAGTGVFSWQELLAPLQGIRPAVAGIVNATPDSFSDGKGSVDAAERVAFALQLLSEGADLLDIGAESTRPGAAEVFPENEWARLQPVLEGVLEAAPQTLISVDTRHAFTAEKALQAGAKIINDVSGFTFDPDMMELAARYDCGVIINHTTAVPQDMQQSGNIITENARSAVAAALQTLTDTALRSGIKRESIMLDVGIGFGKSRAANYELLRNARWFEESFALPFCWGVSRKSLLKSEDDSLEKRIAGSLSLAVKLAEQGVSLLRVHDTAQTFAALAAASEFAGAKL